MATQREKAADENCNEMKPRRHRLIRRIQTEPTHSFGNSKQRCINSYTHTHTHVPTFIHIHILASVCTINTSTSKTAKPNPAQWELTRYSLKQIKTTLD